MWPSYNTHTQRNLFKEKSNSKAKKNNLKKKMVLKLYGKQNCWFCYNIYILLIIQLFPPMHLYLHTKSTHTLIF